jgi:hypothetical protein
MSDLLAQTTRQLEEAVEALKLATALCYASSQYKAMIDAENKFNQLYKQVEQIKELEWQNKCEVNKQELIKLGFELRTGFDVISQDSYKRMYESVIVHKNTPQFTSLTVNAGVPTIEVLAIHCEPEYIWEIAWQTWSSLTEDEQNELIR